MEEVVDVDPGPLVANNEVVKCLQWAVMNAPRDLDILRKAMAGALRENAWIDRLDIHRGRFRYSPEEFVSFICDPLPNGLQSDVETLRKLLDGFPERVDFEQAVARGRGNPTAGQQDRADDGTFGKAHTDRNHDSVMNTDATPSLPPAEQGNTAAYAIRRLSRERPDLLERVKAGDISPHRAMIEAGFRKVPTALDVARKAIARLTIKERELLLQELLGGVTDPRAGHG